MSFTTARSSGNSTSIEQSTADLTLLNQSLRLSRSTTLKTTERLSELDRRLARLEKSLLPIHRQTGKLTRVSKNLESTLRAIDSLLGHHDLVDRESSTINSSQGPNPDNLKPYMASMDRLSSASEVLRRTDPSGEATTISNMLLLLESGAGQLVQVFVRWLKDTSPVCDAGALFDQGNPFPPLSAFFLENAIPLVVYLRTLPVIGAKIAKDLEFEYAEVRARAMEDSLRNCAKEVILDATASNISHTRRSIGRLLDVIFALAKAENVILGTLFLNLQPKTKNDIYAAILPPSINVLYVTGQQLNSVLKKSVHSLVSVAFSTYTELQDRAPEYDEWIRNKASRKDNELGELAHAFRGTCLSSLPEFIDDTKAWGSRSPSGAEASNHAVSAMTLNVVTFMRHLSDVQSTVESFLAVLGPGNWGGPSYRPSQDGGEEPTLITRYLNDVLSTLLTALEARSRSLRSPAIFLLNNISFIRREVLSSAIGDLLGEASEDLLNKRMRSTKANYLDIWSPLVSALLDAGVGGDNSSGAVGTIKAGLGAVKGGVENRNTKDRFVRFVDNFEQIEELHRVVQLDEGEVELRERLKGEVERMVIPTYTKFLAKHRAGEFSKNPGKYLKLDAEELTSRMAALFS